jgi:CMP/dCMP kinase
MQSVKEDLLERDRRDSTREIAPLRRAKNAIVVDTTEMSINQVITHIESIIRTDRDVMS